MLFPLPVAEGNITLSMLLAIQIDANSCDAEYEALCKHCPTTAASSGGSLPARLRFRCVVTQPSIPQAGYAPAARFSGGLPGRKPAKLDNDVARFSVLEKVDWARARKSVIRRLQPRQNLRAFHRVFENCP